MADFNPDAYLQSAAKGGFNPDAYLGTAKNTGPTGTPPPPKEKSGFSPQILPLSNGGKGWSPDDVNAGLYGAVTSTLGTPGDLGFMGLPDTAAVRDLATKLGIKEPGAGEKTAETVGEFLPMLAGGFKAGAEAVPLAGRALRPIGEFAGDTIRGLKPRGVLEGIGKPSSISDVGEKISSRIEAELKALVAKRGPKAQALFDRYLDEGKNFERSILDDYKKSLASHYAEKVASGSLTSDEAQAIHRAADRITGKSAELTGGGGKIDPGMAALEKERRILNDVANGHEVTGAEGISAKAAHDIANLLTNSIKKFVPKEFEGAITGYKELSEPINRFNTALGKKVTAEAGEFLPEVSKTDPKDVPGAFFKSRRSVQELKDLTGDPKFAEQAARDHVANQLTGAKTAGDVDTYLRRNNDWLQEFPALRKELQDAAKTIGRGEGAKTAAKVGAGLVGAGTVGGLAARHLGGL